MVDAKTGALGHVGVAISFGLVIMAMIYAVGHISGAHFNPAVTLRLRAQPPLPLAARCSATGRSQLLGALTAAAILRGSLGNIAHVGATLPSGSQGQSFLWELVMSFFLMFVIMAVATDTRAVGEAAAIAIGGTVGLDAMFGGPISGASMNPARSIGPAFVSGDLHALWLYIVAPIAGAALGALVYQLIRGEPELPGVELLTAKTRQVPGNPFSDRLGVLRMSRPQLADFRDRLSSGGHDRRRQRREREGRPELLPRRDRVGQERPQRRGLV